MTQARAAGGPRDLAVRQAAQVPVELERKDDDTGPEEGGEGYDRQDVDEHEHADDGDQEVQTSGEDAQDERAEEIENAQGDQRGDEDSR